MSITINVAYEVPANAFARVEALAREVEQRDANFGGADIQVKRDDFTCVDDRDEYRGAALLARVYRAIENDQD